MKKAFCVLVLLAGLSLPVAFAQHLYVGTELSQLATRSSSDLSSRELGAQVGLTFGGIGLRAAVAGNVAARTLESGSLDALLNFPLFGNTLYVGAGADIFDLSQLGTVTPLQAGAVESALESGTLGAHAVAGAEVRLGWFGVFGEVQPVYRLGQGFTLEDTYYLRTRAGLNLHF
jgi:hypothetical protein